MPTVDDSSLDALLATLPAPLAEALSRDGMRLSYPRGALLHGTGDDCDGIYVVTKGRVRISSVTEAGRELVVTDLEPGDLFGVKDPEALGKLAAL